MRFAVDISALAGFCQSWQAEKFYLKGCSLLNLQDTKLWLTLFFCECINNKSQSLKITIKILLEFKSKNNLFFFKGWFSGRLQRAGHGGTRGSAAPRWLVTAAKAMEKGRGLGKRSVSELSCYVFYQSLSQSLLYNSFMQYLWHNSYFFPPAIIYDK